MFISTGNAINANSSGLVRYDGAGTFTGVTTTNHAVLIGAASNGITNLALTNGQLAIGSTGADPSAAGLTAGNNISISTGAGSITISALGAGQIVNVTLPGAYPYNVLTTDYIVEVDTTSSRTIRLPNAPSTGQIFVIKDITGSAGSNNISLTTVGGAVTIDGSTTQTMNVNYASVQVFFNGTSYFIY